jgi:hypothetical protein
MVTAVYSRRCTMCFPILVSSPNGKRLNQLRLLPSWGKQFLIDVPDSGYTSALLDQLFSYIGNITTPEAITEKGPLSLSSLQNHLYLYPIFTYSGSLSTLPCSESIPRYISAHPLWIDLKLFNNVKRVLKYDARYTQDNLFRGW